MYILCRTLYSEKKARCSAPEHYVLFAICWVTQRKSDSESVVINQLVLIIQPWKHLYTLRVKNVLRTLYK